MTDRWSLNRGATMRSDGTVSFAVWAPSVERLSVVVRPDDREEEVELSRDGGGVWRGTASGLERGHDYVYRLDGARDRPDPVSRHQPAGVHGPSRIVAPGAFEWTDGDWRGLEMADLIIYELHVGTFTPAGTFTGVAERLPYLRELGVTAIELMPVAQFPGRRNWGYDGVHPYAPQDSYGGPDGLRRLVDAAHREGLGVILDVVYNHLGPEGNYLSEFGPYFTDRYVTPWGKAINFDGPDSDEVRRYFIDNARYWIREFHIDGLRLDAVHAIYDFGAVHILEEIGAAVHAEAASPGRRGLVIAESDLNDPRLTRSAERGGYALDAAWSDDFHHAVHAALTGEGRGYYVDFGDVSDVAKAVRDRFVLDGRYSKFRRRRHGTAAGDVPADRFVVFIQNHDQVGNRAQGERLSSLVSFEQRKLAAALLFLSPYVPLIFMGEEYGDEAPFLYFVDHGDEELLEAVRRGRQREFARFEWGDAIPDPGDAKTFERSRLDPDAADRSPHSELLDLYREAIAVRRAEPALRPGAARVEVESDPEAGWISLLLSHEERGALAVFNLGGATAGPEIVIPAGVWERRLATDDRAYGGPGAETPAALVSEGGKAVDVLMAGHSAALFIRKAG
ncbi:MAG: malto-oligosyltrehalose trehalohydrolase [Gemmatimonadetes bacterium]|uniref:Malto-oligosyltrehalose trehalohydrolase n=1 Tax=Candidatus Kutchimonas denitrificans TaxID=3056748 RepID=A0AAE4ZC54_9BACT|nr:malto-oligosyltrehalose trehalohydrolase [Gemmatimonadota bacterium]NIR76617.1 malto-oligosyltrehalose trehalohydrolase [Candidatus Kutchimonas denitrificans]NIS03386.1 malto-oligosyltrehalose trehalohydrolase [Gemmatimonadota bacterium]NIT69247.1 malto-oligosyltrehalose trehalohydrolase [Gemmatimonadota bacterium]NIU54719.1 malto-oligosyltrehalose trehalohydrolase [Gemmatimonadota bacterium]